MFCINCGKQIPDGAKFCSGCGANQNPDTVVSPAQEPEATPVKEPVAAPVKEPVAAPTPQVDLGELFSDNFGSAQQKPKPAPKKKKKLSGKIKGFLITLLVFVVTASGRGIIKAYLEMGIEGLFGFVGDSIKASQEKTYDELDAMMSELDIVVTGYNRDYWAEDDKTGPLLQVYMKNNTGKSITNIEVAIATWDKNGSPVNLTLDEGEYNTSNITYLTLNHTLWFNGMIYKDKGLGLSSDSTIPERIQAIPVSWTYSDGEKGSNPHTEDWIYKYENRENTRSDLNEIQFPQDLVMSEEDLLAALQTQPLVTTNCEIAQWEEGDLLCATITNNGTANIKTIYVAYATWDADNKPVIVTAMDGQIKTSNVIKILLDDLSVAPGESYGADYGAALHKDSAKVTKFNAIAYYYEDTEGNVWENPYYYAWLNLYEGK